MSAAETPDNELERLQLLRDYRILDTPPERVFDSITELAAYACGAPISLINLIDSGRVWFKSKVGLSAAETSRDIAFCSHAILQRGVMEVSDTAADPRFFDNPLVTESGLRFYAGAPLVTGGGCALGTLCVIDRKPRALTAHEKGALRNLADLVMRLLDARHSEEALRLSKEITERIVDSSHDCVKVLDLDAKLLSINLGGQKLVEICDASVFIGKSWIDFWEGGDREAAERAVEAAKSGGVGHFQGFCPTLTGIAKWWDVIVTPIQDAYGRPERLLCVSRDVTQQHELEQRLSFEASHDSLTGLPNRREFEARGHALLESSRHSQKQHALLYIDLDQFKIINDTCGHLAGDAMLREVATALTVKMRKSDTLARLGGDEFGVLLEGCALPQAKKIAASLIDTIRQVSFDWQGARFSLTASIGLVEVNDASRDLTSLLSNADAACHFAKEKGRNRVQEFRGDDDDLMRRHREMAWTHRITHGLEKNKFCLFYQRVAPLHDLASAQHNEVLLRLNEDGALVPPSTFIPAAERYNLMPALDRWVIRKVFRSHSKAGSYAINLSGTSINDEQFLDFILDEFARTKMPPRSICFEVTETAAISNLSRATEFFRALKKIGCELALDDFGSGLSSFGYLKTLPVDYLKIDGALVKDMADDPVAYTMVEAINRIGHVMGIKTIAEFVENDRVLAELRKLGVNAAQGYGIHKPEPMLESSLQRSHAIS
jgi:diguanylate cyclase (GGDEF)-like protein/PAS domain S-box-containing protein